MIHKHPYKYRKLLESINFSKRLVSYLLTVKKMPDWSVYQAVTIINQNRSFFHKHYI